MLKDLIKKALFENAKSEFSTFSKPSNHQSMTWSYQQLSGEMDRIQDLLSKASAPADSIAFLMLQGGYAYATVFSAILSDRTFVPLSGRQPNSKLLDMIARSFCQLLLTDSALLERSLELQKDGHFDVLNVETGEIYCKEGKSSPTSSVKKNPTTVPAYMVYTSGSTGTPKAVMVSQDNLLSYVRGISDFIQLKRNHRFSQCFELSFDSGLGEVFQALACGASLHPLSPSDIPFIDKYLERVQPTVFSSTPTLISLVQKNKFLRKNFECVLVSMFMGERLTHELVHFWKDHFPQSLIFNLYGPTEATVNVLGHEWNPQDPIEKYGVPLGKAIGESVITLRNENNEVVSDGDEGEIIIEGPQVTLGYFEDLGTTKKFFHQRLYRTGDYGILKNSLIHFIGRKDDQVKIRGFRLQLREVEFRVGEIIPEARVVAGLSQESSTLFLVLDSEISQGQIQDVLSHLRLNLPKYAIPQQVYYLEQWPLTSSGKTDKAKINFDLVNTNGRSLLKI